ncbi:MAG: indolepyruvate ferredoxin oxidoreductase subunit alpha [Oscillospiraceae bacterium]|nr:indolepyruvate ferredoxin oxidoreductase subunit alpha [Oscillospiraceae bacterium]
MKKLMLGNAAVARGLYEHGCRVASSYPGTPSTEITEELSNYPEVYTEWAPNEKVAMEVALGASIGGARSFCAMKHVGLNVAADPLFTASYTGVNGGMVIAVADDPGMHSSQNEQDSRHYAIAAKLPMLEPADSAECRDFVGEAYRISEEYDTPVILRMQTRIAHSQSIVELGERTDAGVKEYTKDPKKYVMMPANAIGRHVVVEERTAKLRDFAETSPLNRVEMADTAMGVIAAGTCYQYVKEALPNASVLKLGMVNPLPVKLIQEFAAKVEKLYIVEELDGIIESHCASIGVKAVGKELFGLLGEYSQRTVAEKLGQPLPAGEAFPEAIPGRPPVLCPGCPHRGMFYSLHKIGVTVSGDIGCYTLGALPPLTAMDTTICMGASISGLHGFNTARGAESAKKSVAVIGDSTFMYSGITGLIDMVYNRGASTVIVLDNSITGMTGHQQNPTTGYDIHGVAAPAVSIEKLCEAIGVNRVRVVDPNNLKEFEATVREELAAEEVSVIISRRPCALLKSVKPKPALSIDHGKCITCKMCFRIGCPAIAMVEGKVEIDPTLCVGCGLCQQLCPKQAIVGGDK